MNIHSIANPNDIYSDQTSYLRREKRVSFIDCGKENDCHQNSNKTEAEYFNPYSDLLLQIKYSDDNSRLLASHVLRNGMSLLMVAAQEGDITACAVLLKYNTNINFQDSIGFTALMYAVRDGHYDIVHLLLDYGADASLSSKTGYSPILCAAQNGFTNIVTLLANSVSIESQDEDGTTPLMCACLNNHISTIHAILQLGANPYQLNHQNKSAIMLSIDNHSYDVIHYFLHQGIYLQYNYQEATIPVLFVTVAHQQSQLCTLIMSYYAYIEEFINYLVIMPNVHAENYLLKCLYDTSYRFTNFSINRLNEILMKHANVYLMMLKEAYQTNCKLQVSLCGLVEATVWCLRCLKLLNCQDLQNLDLFWIYLEKQINLLSYEYNSFSYNQLIPNSDSSDDNFSPSDKPAHIKSSHNIKLFFSLMEIYCLGCGTITLDTESGLFTKYSISKRIETVLKTNSEFFR